MRTARLVGATTDGTSVLARTEDGEDISVVVDDAARALWPSPPTAAPPVTAAATRRPPRRREDAMDTPLSPRDIQMRIRSGESLDDVAAGAGVDAERIERFAAPVLAEREHMALTALGAALRRRGGDSSAHRSLRDTVAERLLGQRVDPDGVAWDSWKRDDHHWQVVADYAVGADERHAEFRFDPQARFALADDDEARWLAGEQPSTFSAAADRDDELALVKAVRERSEDDSEESYDDSSDLIAAVLDSLPPAEYSEEEIDDLIDSDTEEDTLVVSRRNEAAEPTISVVRHLTTVEIEVDLEPEPVRSQLDTLYDMLGSDGDAEDSARVHPGLSDASAVPVTDEHEFEPAVETPLPAEPDPEVDVGGVEPDEPLIPSLGASRKPGRRKRASVPSWDEIMFGGPKTD